VPKDSDSAVKAVVASTFDRIVRDESKDVLIEFYAPWCGHCKVRAHLAPERGNIFQKLEPVYLQLAQKLAGDTKLVLAKYDATANDAPDKYEAEGFPTIYFAPKGRKDTPIKYTGNRDPDDLVKFMKQHSVVSFVGSAKTEL
jgi:protein disulfide-isomerase-like protein